MSHPEYFYYGLIALVALPSMRYNLMAVVVVLCWLPGQLIGAFLPDVSPLWCYGVNGFMDLVALGIGVRRCYQQGSTGNVLTTIFFLPLATVQGMSVLYELGMRPSLHPYYAWWLVFWVGGIQVLLLPLGNNWRPFCQWLYKKGWINDPDYDFHFRIRPI
jgi:hypothetical protein